eukprot:6202068-Pleurochrysis_carterae.AAC.2
MASDRSSAAFSNYGHVASYQKSSTKTVTHVVATAGPKQHLEEPSGGDEDIDSSQVVVLRDNHHGITSPDETGRRQRCNTQLDSRLANEVSRKCPAGTSGL